MEYDVCIVGAGPAGLGAALHLLNNQKKVILLEKKRHPGEKACGGGLTKEADALLRFLMGRRSNVAWDRQSSEPGWGSIPCSKLHVFGSTGVKTSIQTHSPYMFVTRRTEWQRLLIDRIVARGGDVRLGERVVYPGQNEVIASGSGRIVARYIIAADGAKSQIRKSMGLSSAVGAVCRQLVIPWKEGEREPVENSVPSVWFNYRRFGASYGWIFPFEDELRIGCGVPAGKRANRQLKESFNSWLKQLNLHDGHGRMESGSIGCKYAGHRFGNVFLAGDAAGLASPVTGEGIYQAMLSGTEVAREIVTPGYQSSIIPALGARHERTWNALALPGVGNVLYGAAPWLLKLPGLPYLAMRRFS